MVPKYQTRFDNCFQACVASLLEVQLEQVPNFPALYSDEDWYQEFENWIYKTHTLYAYINMQPVLPLLPNRYILVAGKVLESNTETMHCAIYLNGKCVHDPAFQSKRPGIDQIKYTVLFQI